MVNTTRGHSELYNKQKIVTNSAALRLILWSITILKYGRRTVTPRIAVPPNAYITTELYGIVSSYQCNKLIRKITCKK